MPQNIYDFTQIKDSVSDAIRGIFPVAGKNLSIDINDVEVVDNKDEDDISGQYSQLTSGGTWAVPVYANVTLRGANGEIDTGRVKVLSLPKMTSRKTFIIDGKERQIHSVLRRKSGIFTRRNEAGELVSEFNMDNGLHSGGRVDRGAKFHIRFDDKTKEYKVQVGTRTAVRAYDLLKVLGYNTETLRGVLGDDVHEANKKGRSYQASVDATYEAIYGKKAKTGIAIDEKERRIRESFIRTKLDPVSVQATLGKPVDKVDGDVIASTLGRMIRVSRGEIDEDDRESLVFKHIAAPPKLIAEGISHPTNLARIQGQIRSKLNSLKSPPTEVKNAFPASILDKSVKTVLTGSEEADIVDHANPVGLISGHNQVSMLGTGAIGSLEQIPSDAPLVSPSHFGYLDPLHSPESRKSGVSLHFPVGVRASSDGRLLTRMYTPAGKAIDVSAEEAAQSTVAFPDSYKIDLSGDKASFKPVGKTIQVQRSGKIENVSPDEVDYIVARPQQVFDSATNLIPFLQSNQGNRAMMAGKHVMQALPLKYREQPVVQTGLEEKFTSFAGAKKAPVTGEVISVAEVDGAYEIRIKPKSGKVRVIKAYRDFPMPGGIIMDSDLKVKKGDTVKEGDLLSDSSFTKDGVLAMGTTLTAAYMPWHGKAFEDGMIISEDAAEKLTSVHLHERTRKDPDLIKDKAKFLDWFRTRIQTTEEEKALDPEGVIRKGSKVEPGQILIAGLKEVDPRSDEAILRRRSRMAPYDPVTVTWDKDVPGVVTEVTTTPDGTTRVYIKTEEKMKLGDKLVGRNANKGIVTGVVPTAEMPHTKDGKAIDLIMSPLGIPGRINLGQVLEVAVGKIAQKEGRIIQVEPFGRQSYIDEAKADLKKAGLEADEELIDPVTGKSYGRVLTGPQYTMKLEHQISKKARSRSMGKYDRWDTPLGGDGGAQSLGELGTYAMLAHGATENLRDMQINKSQRSDGLWDALINGKPIPVPNHLTQNDRFEGLLRVAGVKLSKGDTVSLIPQNDEDTVRMAMGRKGLKDAGLMLSFNRDRVIPDTEGLFDTLKTGGELGTRWSYFELPEPVANPLFIPAISSMTGWDKKKIRDIAKGVDTYNGKTGGEALKEKLSEIDLAKSKEALMAEAEVIKNRKMKIEAKAKELSTIYKKLRYIDNLQKNEKRPEDAYLMQKIPVIPPKLRPITSIGSGERVSEDINHLYRDLALVANTLRESKETWKMGDAQLVPLRSALNDGMEALVQAKSESKPLSGSYRGVVGTIIGTKPSESGGGEEGEAKSGLFQDSITRRRQDFSGRSTITVEPRLKMDEVGIPFEMAYTIMEPWAIKRLREKYGYSTRDARKYYQDKGEDDPRVRDALIDVSRDRPVFLKRDPTLHKFNVMAFHPQLVEGKAIQIHPLVTGGFNADFDGDAMSVYVPVSDKAVEEAERMLPSNNLFSPANGKIVHTPGHEMTWGISKITEIGKKTNKKFTSVSAAQSALRKGEIKETDVIKLGPRETTMGWEEINQSLPPRFRVKGEVTSRKPLSSNDVRDILTDVARGDPTAYAEAANTLKDIGNRYSTEQGLSVNLDDFTVIDKKFRDDTFAAAERAVDRGEDPIKAYGGTIRKIDKHNKALLDSGEITNNLYGVVQSGARGNWSQFKQIVSAPTMVYDVQNRIVPRLIKNSYSEGLTLADYWTATHGARKGAINKSISTSKPGYLSKQIMRTSIDQVITEDDCGTRQGVNMSVTDPSTLGRYIVSNVEITGSKRNRNVKRGTLITPDVSSSLKAGKLGSITVRSPMRCESKSGVCAKCMGLNEEGSLSSIGDNVGVIAAQSIGQPSTQLTLNVFHTGGVVEDIDKAVEGNRLANAENLLRLTKNIPNSAILSPRSGVVETMTVAPQGGHDLTIGGNKLHIPRDKKVFNSIRIGKELQKGEPLTVGLIHPMEIFKLKGANAAQETLVDQLYNLFKGSGVQKKHFEVVARGMTSHTRVIDPGGSEFLPGQAVNLNMVKAYNKENPADQRVKHLPIIKGVSMAPLVSENWLARLNAERLRETLVNAANQGWASDVKGPHPIPALTFLGEVDIKETSGFGRPIRTESTEGT